MYLTHIYVPRMLKIHSKQVRDTNEDYQIII